MIHINDTDTYIHTHVPTHLWFWTLWSLWQNYHWFQQSPDVWLYLQVQLSSALTAASIWNFLTEYFPVRKCQFVQREIFHENVLITMTFLLQTEIIKAYWLGRDVTHFWTYLEWNILILFPNYFEFRKVYVAFDTFFN